MCFFTGDPGNSRKKSQLDYIVILNHHTYHQTLPADEKRERESDFKIKFFNASSRHILTTFAGSAFVASTFPGVDAPSDWLDIAWGGGGVYDTETRIILCMQESASMHSCYHVVYHRRKRS